MTLIKLLEDHPWYAGYIHTAMKRYLETNPFVDRSPAKLQCELILLAIEKDHLQGTLA